MKTIATSILCALFLAVPAHGQLLKDLGDSVKKRVNREIDKTVDEALDEVFDETRDKRGDSSSKSKSNRNDTNKPRYPYKSFSEAVAAEYSPPKPSAECAENPYIRRGEWEKAPDALYYQPTADETRYERDIGAVMDRIQELVSAHNPRPLAAAPIWYRWFEQRDHAPLTFVPEIMNYHHVSAYFPYSCLMGAKVDRTHETPNWLKIEVNSHNLAETTPQWSINEALNTGYFTIAAQHETWDGYPVMERIPKGPWRTTRLKYSVLVHRPGELPYRVLTRGEFLAMNHKYVDSVKSSAADRATRHKNLAALERKYAGTLDEPANIDQSSWRTRNIDSAETTEKAIRYGFQDIFVAPDEGHMFVETNPDYFRRDIPKWKPQFIWVNINVPLRNAAGYHLAEVMKTFDYDSLRQLLD